MHVLHQNDVPTSDYWRIQQQHTFWGFRTNTHHAARRLKPFGKGHMMGQISLMKWDCFLVLYKILHGYQMLQYQTIWEIFFRIRAKLLEEKKKKKRVLLCSVNAWIITRTMFLVILKQCCRFSIVQSFQFEITTLTTYLQGKRSRSIDWKYNYHECHIICIKWHFPCTNHRLLPRMFVISL